MQFGYKVSQPGWMVISILPLDIKLQYAHTFPSASLYIDPLATLYNVFFLLRFSLCRCFCSLSFISTCMYIHIHTLKRTDFQSSNEWPVQFLSFVFSFPPISILHRSLPLIFLNCKIAVLRLGASFDYLRQIL